MSRRDGIHPRETSAGVDFASERRVTELAQLACRSNALNVGVDALEQADGRALFEEVLRLAPDLLISQPSTSKYVEGPCGFGGAEELQNVSNKPLILIDGRSVHSPLYSTVSCAVW